MSYLKRLLFFLVFSLSFAATGQHTLTILVENVSSSDGLIAVAVYTNEESFLNEKQSFQGVFEEAEKDTVRIQFPNIPDGTYAICLFHDENGNKELDTNFFGIPKEPIGFSIGKVKTFGPPSFEECSFEVNSDFEIKIPIE